MTKGLLEHFHHWGPHPIFTCMRDSNIHARVLDKEEVSLDVCLITLCFHLCISLTRSQEDLDGLMWQMNSGVSVTPLALKLKTYLHFSMYSDFGEKFLANSTFLGEHFLATTRITPRPRRLAYRFSGSSLCISGLHSTLRRVRISVRSMRAESGERRAL